MLKHLYFLSLVLFFAFADQCNKANKDWCTEDIPDHCNFDFEPAIFESVPNSCEFFPHFEIEFNPGDSYEVYAIAVAKNARNKCKGYVNDCCGKSLAKKESCRLPSPPSDTGYYLNLHRVNKTVCYIFITTGSRNDGNVTQRYINIDRDKQYCYFELPAGIHHLALKNMTSDSDHLVEINPGWKYHKKKMSNQYCPELLTTGIELTKVILSDSEEVDCVELKTDDTSLKLLMKQRTTAVDSARCLYIHSHEGFVCLPPDLPTTSHVHNVLVILLPLMGFIAGASIIIISCYRHTIKKKFRWFFCLEKKFDVKLDGILYFGGDEGGIADKFLPEAEREEPSKIEFVNNHSDITPGLLCNDSTAEHSHNETSLVINMEQEMILEDKHEIDEENAYVQQEDIQELMIRLNHGEDGNNGKELDIIYSKDIANQPANLPEVQRTSGRATLDSGLGSTGSGEGTSYSQTNKADFSVGVLTEEYDCCFDEDPDIVLHDGYIDSETFARL